jgi:hypothetical protein
VEYTHRERKIRHIRPSLTRSPEIHVPVGYEEVVGEEVSVAEITRLLAQSSFDQILKSVAFVINALATRTPADP